MRLVRAGTGAWRRLERCCFISNLRIPRKAFDQEKLRVRGHQNPSGAKLLSNIGRQWRMKLQKAERVQRHQEVRACKVIWPLLVGNHQLRAKVYFSWLDAITVYDLPR